jgi:hypothetical protein
MYPARTRSADSTPILAECPLWIALVMVPMLPAMAAARLAAKRCGNTIWSQAKKMGACQCTARHPDDTRWVIASCIGAEVVPALDCDLVGASLLAGVLGRASGSGA